jgi:hypothetical protein
VVKSSRPALDLTVLVVFHFPFQSRFQEVFEQGGEQTVFARQGFAFIEPFDGRLFEGLIVELISHSKVKLKGFFFSPSIHPFI